jgi:hypothetical protein
VESLDEREDRSEIVAQSWESLYLVTITARTTHAFFVMNFFQTEYITNRYILRSFLSFVYTLNCSFCSFPSSYTPYFMCLSFERLKLNGCVKGLLVSKALLTGVGQYLYVGYLC